MPTRYTTENVAGIANKLTLVDILTGTQAEPKRVSGLYVTEYTATEENDAIITAFVGTEKLMEFNIQHLLSVFDVATRQWSPFIPFDVDLPIGNVLALGHMSGSTASDVSYTVAWDPL